MGNNGNGYDQGIDTEELKKYIQGTDSITSAFGETGGSNAVGLLMEQAKEFIDNTFRYDIPNTAVALCIALSMQRCEEHGYTEGVLFWKYVLGLLASKRAQRANLFVDAIVGDRKWKQETQRSFMGKANDFMFGKKE